MKLSMSLLGSYLEKYQPEYHITEDSLSIKGVRFLSDPRQLSSLDYVYLGAAKGYFQDVKYENALLLVNGNNQIICRGADYEELLNDVLSAFEYYNNFELDMNAAAMGHEPLAVMLRRMGEIYHSPILIFDMEGNLIGESNMELVPEKDFLHFLETQHRMEIDTLGSTIVDENGIVSHDLSDEPRHLFSVEAKNVYGAVSMYLMQEEERLGFIMIFPVNDRDLLTGTCLEVLFAEYCVMSEEFSGRESVLKPRRSVMRSLLAGEPVEEAALRRFAHSMQLHPVSCLIAFENQGIQNYTLRSMIIRELSEEGSSLACEYEGKIVIMTGNDQAEKVIRWLKGRMPFGNYAIGVSMPVQDIRDLAVAVKQAFFAINAQPQPGVRYCRNLALNYLMQLLKSQDMVLELLHPAIRILKNYDEMNKAELLETLKSYLQNGCSQRETAEKMNIHINTLKYRMKRISELGMINFKDEEEMLYIRISMYLAEEL